MIKLINIKNFQSHKSTTLELHPGVNVIVGTSDSGKTAIVRAFRWVVENKPSGDSFRTRGSKETEIETILNDSDFIRTSRIKAKSENEYILTINEDTEAFKAFGQGVPEEISKTLNIGEINLQQQFDAHYLLSSSPGEVARILNKCTNLDVIHKTLSSIYKTARDNKSDISAKEANLDNLQFVLGEYDYLPRLERLITNLETKEEIEQALQTKENTLLDSIARHDRITDNLNATQIILKNGGKVSYLAEKLATVGDKALKQADLEGIIEKIQAQELKVAEAQAIQKATRAVTQLLVSVKKYNDTDYKEASLKRLLSNIGTIEGDIIDEREQAILLQEQFDELMPNVCPLCGNRKRRK